MTPQNFCYWLQEYIEMHNPETIGVQETKMIKEHLALVFNKVTESNLQPYSEQKFRIINDDYGFDGELLC